MNCQEALDLLYDIIDKEASDIDTQQVQEHLNHCRDCFEKYKVEGAVHDFIKAKLDSDTPGPRLDTLKSRILTRLAGGNRSSLGTDERRVLALWAGRPGNNNLRAAASLFATSAINWSVRPLPCRLT